VSFPVVETRLFINSRKVIQPRRRRPRRGNEPYTETGTAAYWPDTLTRFAGLHGYVVPYVVFETGVVVSAVRAVVQRAVLPHVSAQGHVVVERERRAGHRRRRRRRRPAAGPCTGARGRLCDCAAGSRRTAARGGVDGRGARDSPDRASR